MVTLPSNIGHIGTLQPDGSVDYMRETWPLLYQNDTSNPWDEEVVTAGGHSLYHGRRGCCVYRIRSTPAGQAVSKGFIRRVDFGQALGCNERWTNSVRSTMINPTMMGAGYNPQDTTMNRGIPSPPVFYRNSTSGTSAICEGAVIPFSFDSYGFEHAENAHFGGDERTFALMTNMRMFQRVETNYGGRTDVHRVMHASYWPRVWDTSIEAMSQLLFMSGPRLTDDFADYAEFFSPRSGRIETLGTDWSGSTSLTINFRHNETEYFGDVNAIRTNFVEGDADGDFVCGIVKTDDWRSTGEPFAVGVGAHILPYDEEMTRLTEFSFTQSRAAGLPAAGEDVSSGQRLEVRTRGSGAGKSGKRRVGWIGHQWFLVTKPTPAECRTALSELFDSGEYAEPFDWNLVPDAVLDGTTLPPELS